MLELDASAALAIRAAARLQDGRWKWRMSGTQNKSGIAKRDNTFSSFVLLEPFSSGRLNCCRGKRHRVLVRLLKATGLGKKKGGGGVRG